MKLSSVLILALLLLLLLAIPALAQDRTPPETPTPQWSGTVSGRIINNTPGGTVPESVSLMLHAWDESFTEKLMRHAESAPDGSFRFDEVRFEPGLTYAVMATYQGVTYFSDPATVTEGEDTLELEVPIYETTTDASLVLVDRMHIIFAPGQGGLTVTELYSLSNLGDRTITGTITLEDGGMATLRFPLPEDAANVGFNDDYGGRFVQVPGGFADTAPLLPGQGSGRVVASYVLPYSDGMTFSYTAPYITGGVNLLLPADSGLALSGEGLIDGGVRTLGAGATFAIFTHDALEAGESLRVVLTGDLAGMGVADQEDVALAGRTAFSARTSILVGGVVLGLALVVTGLWWLRQAAEDEAEEVDVTSFDDVVMQIAQLDEAHEQGLVSDEDYEIRRTALREQARLLLQQD